MKARVLPGLMLLSMGTLACAFVRRGAAIGGLPAIGGAAPWRAPTRTFAQPRKKLPERTVVVICTKCGAKLFKYHKNGKGSLVKCYEERIAQDFTDGDAHCPSCGTEFARATMIHGRPAFKIIGGKAKLK